MPRHDEVDAHHETELEREQEIPREGEDEEPVGAGEHERQRQEHPLQGNEVLDDPRAQTREAEKELHGESEQHGPERAQHELGHVVLPRHVARVRCQRQHSPGQAQPSGIREVDLARIEPADRDEHAAQSDQDQAARLDPLAGPGQPCSVGLGERRLLSDLDARQAGRRLSRRDAIERMPLDPEVEHVVLRAKERGRQRDELRPRAVARHRLLHATAAEDQRAVEMHLQVAAGALDVHGDEIVGRHGASELEPGPVPDAAAVAGPRLGPHVGKRQLGRDFRRREPRLAARDRERAIDDQPGRLGAGGRHRCDDGERCQEQEHEPPRPRCGFAAGACEAFGHRQRLCWMHLAPEMQKGEPKFAFRRETHRSRGASAGQALRRLAT